MITVPKPSPSDIGNLTEDLVFERGDEHGASSCESLVDKMEALYEKGIHENEKDIIFSYPVSGSDVSDNDSPPISDNDSPPIFPDASGRYP